MTNPRYWRIFRWTFKRNDPRRYGAILGGKTDCTQAFQRALDKAGHVLLAPGTYLIHQLGDESEGTRL